MPVIVPRWEWRTFGQRFGGRRGRVRGDDVDRRVHDSDETYLLVTAAKRPPTSSRSASTSWTSRSSARSTPVGLERWEPVLKVGFPMPAADVGRVIDALHLPPAALDPRGRTRSQQFLDEVAGPSGMVRPVDVHKHRVRYTVGGCSSEVSDVIADGRTIRTIAIESPDAAAVVAAVRSVGLDGYPNTNYPRGLAALLDGRPERYAVIDVGTNSIKFHVAELAADGQVRTVVDRAEVTRLGQGVDAGGEIVPEALERAVVAIAGMADEAKALGATATARSAPRGCGRPGTARPSSRRSRPGPASRSRSSRARRRAGSPTRPSRSGLGSTAGSLVVFDTGGGSSQFTFGHDGRGRRAVQRPGRGRALHGAVRAGRAVSADGPRRGARGDRRGPRPASTAGRDPTPSSGWAAPSPTSRPSSTRWPSTTRRSSRARSWTAPSSTARSSGTGSLDADGRRSIVGPPAEARRGDPRRARCIVRTVMDKLGQTSLTVSDRGLRHGVLAEQFRRADGARQGGGST